MKARVPFKNSVSKKRLAEAEEFIHTELKNAKQEEMTRTLKIFAYSLHSILGFGEKRTKQYLDNFSEFMNNIDELFWDRIDETLFDELHLEEREKLLK